MWQTLVVRALGGIGQVTVSQSLSCWMPRSIGVAAALGPKQRRQELAVKEVKGRVASSRTWRVSHITGLPLHCLLAPNPHAHLKSFDNWPTSLVGGEKRH